MHQYKPAKIATGIGVSAALFILLTTILLFVVPQELLSSSGRTTYIETWADPIMAVGGIVFSVGIPLACAGTAYYLTTKDHSPGSVIIGFLIGGFVFIAGNATLGVTVTHFFAYGAGLEQSLLGHMQNGLPHGMRLFGGGLIGVAGALVVEEYV